MSELPIFITTFNCGKESIHKNPNEFYQCFNDVIPPNICDLYVFGFQEITSILNTTLSNTIDGIMNQIGDNLTLCLSEKFDNSSFKVISCLNFGGLGLFLVSPESKTDKFTEIYKSVGFPVGHLLTNLKGGIGIRIIYDENIELTFVNVHLNAGEKIYHLIKRNDDLDRILNYLKFDDGYTALKSNTSCFIFGDFNYRATGAFNIAKISDSELNEMLRFDELSILRLNNLILNNFNEHEITFKPTYKLKLGKLNYNLKRKPSWCDRILYFKSSNLDFDVLKYNSIKNCLISDHLPVYLSLNISKNNTIYLKQNEMKNTISSKALHYYATIYTSYITTYLLGTGLFLGTTNKGRLICLLSILGYFIYFNYL